MHCRLGSRAEIGCLITSLQSLVQLPCLVSLRSKKPKKLRAEAGPATFVLSITIITSKSSRHHAFRRRQRPHRDPDSALRREMPRRALPRVELRKSQWQCISRLSAMPHFLSSESILHRVKARSLWTFCQIDPPRSPRSSSPALKTWSCAS